MHICTHTCTQRKKKKERERDGERKNLIVDENICFKIVWLKALHTCSTKQHYWYKYWHEISKSYLHRLYSKHICNTYNNRKEQVVRKRLKGKKHLMIIKVNLLRVGTLYWKQSHLSQKNSFFDDQKNIMHKYYSKTYSIS